MEKFDIKSKLLKTPLKEIPEYLASLEIQTDPTLMEEFKRAKTMHTKLYNTGIGFMIATVVSSLLTRFVGSQLRIAMFLFAAIALGFFIASFVSQKHMQPMIESIYQSLVERQPKK